MLSVVRDISDLSVAGLAYVFGRLSKRVDSSLAPIERITQLSPLVCRVLGANPGAFTLRGTNTYLVGSGTEKILIDTGEKNVPAYINDLKEAIGSNRIGCIVCTHSHPDHVGGIKDVTEKVIGKSVPVFKFKKNDSKEEASLYVYVDDNHILTTEGATLRLIKTPGHTKDHMSIYLVEDGTLFSGDCILGEGSTIFEDLHSYMNSLQKLLELQPKRIFPGHGPVVTNPREKIIEYIAHRNARESQILDVLRGSSSPMSAMSMTNTIYTNLSSHLKIGAFSNVKHHLRKLLIDGRIEKAGFNSFRICDKQ